MDLDSPYQPGAGLTPPQRAGRHPEIAEAMSLLSRIENYGAPRSAPTVFTGVRGIGKTVLLREIATLARQRGFLTATSTADSDSALPQRLAVDVAKSLTRMNNKGTGTLWQRWKDRLAGLDIELSVAGLTVTKPADPKTSGIIDRSALQDLLVSSAQVAAEHEYKGICLTVDEVQSAPKSGRITLAHLLQELGDDQAPHRILIICAGLPNTPEALGDAGTFTERFDYRKLVGLTLTEAAEALLAPANRLGVVFAEPAVDLLLSEAHGSPYLIQLYADRAWRVAAPSHGGLVAHAHVEQGLAVANAQLHDGMFRARWNRAAPTERRFLTTLAQVAGPDGGAEIGAIGQQLGRSTQQLSTIRARLIDKGLVEPAGRGRLRFSTPGFDRYIRGQLTTGQDE